MVLPGVINKIGHFEGGEGEEWLMKSGAKEGSMKNVCLCENVESGGVFGRLRRLRF